MPEADRVLTLLDYASLTMGLELLPHRAHELFAYFGLDDQRGRREVAAWVEALAGKPDDAAECAQMRTRMRPHWVRWDRDTPPPRVVAETSPTPAAPVAPVETTQLSLLEYASLMQGLARYPDRADEVYEKFGLKTMRARDLERAAWTRRLAAHPEELPLVEQAQAKLVDYWARWGLAAAKPTKKARRAPKHPPRKSYSRPKRLRPPGEDDREHEAPAMLAGAAAVARDGSEPSALALLDYAALSFRLENAAPHRLARIFADYGLDVPTGQIEVERWKQRLRADPDERARFDALCERMAIAREREEVAPSSVRISDVDLTIQQYAELCAAWEHDPRAAEQLFERFGLSHPAARAAVDHLWRARLQRSPEDYASFERLRAEYRAAQRRASGEQQVAPPETARGFASEEPPLGLFEYAILCVELDNDSSRGDELLSGFGLREWTLDRVHAVWQTRFQTDTAARTEWVANMNRLRRNWKRTTR